jgi:hypothetical protein
MKPVISNRQCCKAQLSGARVVIEGDWMCPDCACEYDYGPTERRPRPQRPKEPQREKLFP